MAGANEITKLKRERASAKSLFTKACNRLSEAINIVSDVDLIEAKFATVRVKWSNVQLKHDAYIIAAFPEGEGDDDGEIWINDLEERFEVIEKAKFDYAKGMKQKTEKDNQVIKHEIEERLIVNKLEVEERKRKSIRDMQNKIFQQEVHALEILIKADGDGTMKVQIAEGIRDVKLQLERCREAHMHYLESLQTGEADNENIDGLHEIQSKVNRKVAEYFTSISKNKECTVKIEKMKLPKFEGEMRKYAKFKSDFNKYIVPNIKLTDSRAYVLRTCLGESVKNVIMNIQDNIDEIWNRLDEKYGDPSRVADMVINDVRRLKYIKEGDNKAFMVLVETIERGYRDLVLLGIEKEISNTGTVSIIEERLPRDIRREWSKEVKKEGSKVDLRDKFPSLMHFLLEQKKFIEYECSDLRSGENYKSKVHYINEENKDSVEDEIILQVSSYNQKCIVHDNSNSHTTEECRNFTGMDVKTRIQLVRDRKGCWSCLKIGHRSAECGCRKLCDSPGCGWYHHSLLHEATIAPVHSLDSKFEWASERCLLPLMNIQCKGKNINVLWDTGATISLITFKAANKLGLAKGAKRSLTVVKVGGNTEEMSSYAYVLPLKDEKNKIVFLHVYGVETISSNINKIDISGVRYLFRDSHSEEIVNVYGDVDVLVGMNYASMQPQRVQISGNLALCRNRFGKCIAGSHVLLKGENSDEINVFLLNNKNTILERFFSIEEMGVSCIPKCGCCKCGKCPVGGKDFTIKEERELKLIEEGLVHRGNHWESTYPWCKDPNLLPNNRMIVFKMFQSTEKRLLKDPLKAKIYNDQIKDMVKRDVARKLTEAEKEEYKGPVFYLAQHEVIREESKSTPCRLVFNSSAKMFGHKINDYWVKGPNLLNNLLGVLLRFREDRCAIIGDIRKMFNAIKISKLDQNTHRFLWRNLNLNQDPDDYVMTSVSFGDTPSASIAIMALKRTA